MPRRSSATRITVHALLSTLLAAMLTVTSLAHAAPDGTPPRPAATSVEEGSCDWIGRASGGTTSDSGDNAEQDLAYSLVWSDTGQGCTAELDVATMTQHGGPCPQRHTSSYQGPGTYTVYLSTAFNVYMYGPTVEELVTSCDGTSYTLDTDVFGVVGCPVPEDLHATSHTVQAFVLSCETVITTPPYRTWSLIRMRRPVCDPAVDSDGGGIGDCEEFEKGTDTTDPEDDELTACRNGIDDDLDGVADAGNDPGCVSVDDPNELGTAQCDNGVDDDLDGRVDFRPGGAGDADCTSLLDESEQAECSTTMRYSAADLTGRLVAAGMPDPEIATVGLGVRWCIDNGVARVQSVPGSSVVPTANWVLLGTLENLGFTLEEGSATVVSNPRYASIAVPFELRLSALELLSTFTPAGKLVAKLGRKLTKVVKPLRALQREVRRAKSRAERRLAERALYAAQRRASRNFERKAHAVVTSYTEALLDKVDDVVAGLPGGNALMSKVLRRIVNDSHDAVMAAVTRFTRPARLTASLGRSEVEAVFINAAGINVPLWDALLQFHLSDAGTVTWDVAGSRSHLPFTVANALTQN